MPYGEFEEPKSFLLTGMPGKDDFDYDFKGGYCGMFTGSVYLDGTKIEDAKEYFHKLAKDHGKDEFDYYVVINDEIEDHCRQYIFPHIKDYSKYEYICGFGGDEMDGTIFFRLEQPLDDMPLTTTFEIDGKTYEIKWEYFVDSDE